VNSTDSDSNSKNRKDNGIDDQDDDDNKDENRIRESISNNNDDGNKDKKTEVNKDKSVDPQFKRLVWYLIASTRGGVNRAKIIDFLNNSPSNPNQLSIQLELDYKTIIHHLEVLKKNSLVITDNEESYGATYFISPLAEKNYTAFEEIMAKIGKK